jgi:hypothetical protein
LPTAFVLLGVEPGTDAEIAEQLKSLKIGTGVGIYTVY